MPPEPESNTLATPFEIAVVRHGAKVGLEEYYLGSFDSGQCSEKLGDMTAERMMRRIEYLASILRIAPDDWGPQLIDINTERELVVPNKPGASLGQFVFSAAEQSIVRKKGTMMSEGECSITMLSDIGRVTIDVDTTSWSLITDTQAEFTPKKPRLEKYHTLEFYMSFDPIA